MERLDKYLASQSGLTRSQAREKIWSGAVSVNGKICKENDKKIDPEKDDILLEGSKVSYFEYLYIMMNKPSGYVSATRDRDEKTVVELLPEEYRRRGIAPAGRLDKDTEGLLILTDDGAFAHKLTAPGKNVYKRYIATLDIPADEEDAKAFAEGITIDGGEVCRSARMKVLPENNAQLDICEGKYHQVKRMFAARGKNVIALRRIKIGTLDLDKNLAKGECRLLTEDDLKKLLKNG